MRPASSARHTHSLQQQRRRRQQLHVGRRLRPAAATALAKKQEPAETAAATPLRRGAGRAASRRTGAHLRAALPPPALPAPLPACRALAGVGPERSRAERGARQERCPAGALPAACAPGAGERRQRFAAPLRYPGAGREGVLSGAHGVSGASPLAAVCPLGGPAEGAGGGPG